MRHNFLMLLIGITVTAIRMAFPIPSLKINMPVGQTKCLALTVVRGLCQDDGARFGKPWTSASSRDSLWRCSDGKRQFSEELSRLGFPVHELSKHGFLIFSCQACSTFLSWC